MYAKLTKRLYHAIMLALIWPALVMAAGADDAFLNAKNAYDKRNVLALTSFISELKTQEHVLAPYAEYWLMLLNLEVATAQEVQEFLHTHAAMPFADRLRGEWLKKLAKIKDWPAFLAMYAQYQQEDSAVICYAAQANAEVNGIDTLASAKSLWMQTKEQAANCNALFDQMQAVGILTEEDLLKRYRLALTDNRINLAKAIVKRAKGIDATYVSKIDAANTNPQLLLNKLAANTQTAYGRELYLHALHKLAKNSSDQALTAYKKVEHLLTADEKSYFYALLAHAAAMRHENKALDWYKLTANATMTKDQLEWYMRAALRQDDWKAVLAVATIMPAEQAEEATWRYWRARALKTAGQHQEANTLLAGLSTERHFYGWLAQEELGPTMGAQMNQYKPSEIEVSAFSKLESVKRVEALQRLDFKWEAKLEWVFATEGLDDQQLIAASEYAARKKWYDLSVATADKTTAVHNFALRYPTPYRDLMKPAAAQQMLDEAWVYGIIRQESRFMHYAKSNVGAAGLMQVMPATAKWIANKAGWRDYHNDMIHDLDTNISLGTYYMRYTLEMFNGQEVMATAAYNAGPSRAKKWASTNDLEGAIYAETIPFSETRNYVKKVLANAHLYAKQLGLESVPLNARLGVVPARLDVQVYK